MATRSKLVRMKIQNIGCIGPEGLVIELDNVLCLVGANNSGKSTVLRAYELAIGTLAFSKDRDVCHRGRDLPASVELWIHVPRGMANIAEKWKTAEDTLLLVRSKWEWNEANNWTRSRQTWDPELNAFAIDDRASGLDTVFSSRMPKPFRIGTLDNPDEEHQKLLTLILQPVCDRIKANLSDSDSELSTSLRSFIKSAESPIAEEQEKLKGITKQLTRTHNEIFPDLSIDFDLYSRA